MKTEDRRGNFGETPGRGASVSYLEIEQAAIGILLAGETPSAATVRKALGDRGSQQTLLDGLKRFRRDLGMKASGDPAALSRLPIEIVETVETIWQRALSLASQSAKTDENEARQHLERLRIANEVREHSLSLREKEMDTQARERERALADARDQLLGSLRSLSKAQEEIKAKDRRIGSLESQVADYRRQIESFAAKPAGRVRTAKPRAPRRLSGRRPTTRPKAQIARRQAKRRAAPRRPRR